MGQTMSLSLQAIKAALAMDRLQRAALSSFSNLLMVCYCSMATRYLRAFSSCLISICLLTFQHSYSTSILSSSCCLATSSTYCFLIRLLISSTDNSIKFCFPMIELERDSRQEPQLGQGSEWPAGTFPSNRPGMASMRDFNQEVFLCASLSGSA